MWLCARCVRKSQGGQAAASGRSSAIHPYVGRKAKPTLPTTASAAYAIDHEQAPNCPPIPRSFVPIVDEAAAWSPCVAKAARCCCFADDCCLLSAALSSAATHSPRPTLDWPPARDYSRPATRGWRHDREAAVNDSPACSCPSNTCPRFPSPRHDTTFEDTRSTSATRTNARTLPFSLTGRNTYKRDSVASPSCHIHIRTHSLPPMSSSNQGHGALSRPKSRDPHATIGQFSFAPATRTTVVTTTYTTTVNIPPMRINAPSLSERDPKEYPLAQVRAPESIRKIYFDAGGEVGLFEEADDALKRVKEVCRMVFQGSALFPNCLPRRVDHHN